MINCKKYQQNFSIIFNLLVLNYEDNNYVKIFAITFYEFYYYIFFLQYNSYMYIYIYIQKSKIILKRYITRYNLFYKNNNSNERKHRNKFIFTKGFATKRSWKLNFRQHIFAQWRRDRSSLRISKSFIRAMLPYKKWF